MIFLGVCHCRSANVLIFPLFQTIVTRFIYHFTATSFPTVCWKNAFWTFLHNGSCNFAVWPLCQIGFKLRGWSLTERCCTGGEMIGVLCNVFVILTRHALSSKLLGLCFRIDEHFPVEKIKECRELSNILMKYF